MTGRGTRASSQLGSTFLTGVDRRVHAPLGTVMNFSQVVTRDASRRRQLNCCRVIRSGGRHLLRLVGRVLSLSGVRSNVIRFAVAPMHLRPLYGRVRSTRVFHYPRKIRLVCRPSSRGVIVSKSGGQVFRIVSGLVNGTFGFAAAKRVDCKCHQRNGCMTFRIASANVNVTPSGISQMFRHFIGIGGFTRNAKLKLSVYGAVVRHLNNGVSIASRINGNAAFAFILPLRSADGARTRGGRRSGRRAATRARSARRENGGTTPKSSPGGRRIKTLPAPPSGAVLVTRSARDGFVLVGTVLNQLCQLGRTGSNVRTMAVFRRIRPSLVLVSVGVPGLNKVSTAHVVHRLMPSIPVVTLATCTCRRSGRTTLRTNYGSFLAGPFARRILGRAVGG